MSRTIRMGAILWREGRLLLLRGQPSAPWGLPGCDLPEGDDDMDAAMDAFLESIGVNAPAVEEDFSHTTYLESDGDSVVFNVYVPTEWEGEPQAAAGIGHGWFSPEELDAVSMDAAIREAIRTALGLSDGAADTDAILQAVSAGLGAALGTAATGSSRRERGLDVLRTLGGRDPAQAHTQMRARMPGLADDVVDFALGEVWATAPLDRRTRSLQVVAMLAALGRTGPLRSHVAGALNHGATPAQIVETLRMVSVYAGFPAAIEAAEVVNDVFRERGIEPAAVQS